MPRKAPKEVIEHRLTLGDYERAQLVDVVKAYNRDKYLENVPNMLIGAGTIGIAAAIGIAAYGLYQWFDLPSLKEKVKEAIQETALDLGDLMAKYGFDAAGFEARMIARVNSFESEKEVLDYYNPIIEDLENALIQIDKFPDQTYRAKVKAKIESNLAAAKDARTKAIIQTGFKTGEGQQARQYQMAALTSQIVTAYRYEFGGPPANSYIGGPGEQGRIEYRDALTAHIQAKVVEFNENLAANGESFRYAYVGPTNADVSDPRPSDNPDMKGQMIQFYKLNNNITRYEI